MPAKTGPGRAFVAQNRRARHDYDILDTYEAGIVLVGGEVKSFREGRVQLRDSFARVQDGEVWLHGMHISPYAYSSGFGYADPDRSRKLLLHRRQIHRADAPDPARPPDPRATVGLLQRWAGEGRAGGGPRPARL